MYCLALKVSFLHIGSGQEGTLECLVDKTLGQSFDHKQKLHWQNTRHPDDDLKNTLCPIKKKKQIPITESILILPVSYIKKKMTENLKGCRLFFKEWETSALMLITMNQALLETHAEYL